MKTKNVTTALAFLVAAFMWGCQESGPVAPEGLGPQFGHKPSHNPGCGRGEGGTLLFDRPGGEDEDEEDLEQRPQNPELTALLADHGLEGAWNCQDAPPKLW